ncbi:MAG: D-alanine--D-alanine ligase [Bacteroidales bacterium]|nr:D-alanine--D-alanine ligase [Bacteroidales bacterium]
MERKRIPVAIIAGGDSSEYDISLKSAQNVLDHIDKKRFDAEIVEIRGHQWQVVSSGGKRYPVNRHNFSWTPNGKEKHFAAVFNAIHGTPGENGLLPAYFKLIGIPVTGCESFAGALTFNKYFCNQFLKQAGIQVANSILIHKSQPISTENITAHVGLPCVVKPNNGGSSLGASLVTNTADLQNAIDLAFHEDRQVLIESWLNGPEITCAVMHSTTETMVFPLTQVISKKKFFDYEAKYTPGMADEITPAPLPEKLTRSIQDLSLKVFNLLDCRGVVRMDYIIQNDTPYFLEVNTIPGLTRESIVPKQAGKSGLSLKALISMLLDEAIAR